MTREESISKAGKPTPHRPIQTSIGELHAREMTAKEADSYRVSNTNKDGSPNLDNYRARYLARVLTDHNGARLFTDQDADLIVGWGESVVDEIYIKILRLEKDAEEILKN